MIGKVKTLFRLLRDLNRLRGMDERLQLLAPMAGHPQMLSRSIGLASMLKASTLDSWFAVRLNGVALELPRYTMTTMLHCIAVANDGSIRLVVEADHWNIMRRWLAPGSLFLDIGAATGAMSVPYAKSLDDVRVVAFEPSRRAAGYLRQTLARNGIAQDRARVMQVAISSAPAKLAFMEYPEDLSGAAPFLPEASRIRVGDEAVVDGAEQYEVDVRTLDQLAAELDLDRPARIVAKIDVEGFETEVLRGALETIRRHRPYFSIDIHNYPASTISTKADVTAILAAEGYTFEDLDHVVLATPPAGRSS